MEILTMNGAVKRVSTRCGSCNSAFDAGEWRKLELVETLASHAIAHHALGWPDGLSIEIRRCTCGRPIARKPLDLARARAFPRDPR